jgi:hypothetical protein
MAKRVSLTSECSKESSQRFAQAERLRCRLSIDTGASTLNSKG